MPANLYDHVFRTYGNLMFYQGHQPDYFYFKSLDTYKGKNPLYAERAKAIADAGRGALANPPTFSGESDMPALKKLETALEFLKKAVNYERQNEIAYFKSKFAALKDTFKQEELNAIKEVTDLENLFSHGISTNFDYDKMILLINILEQGLNQTKVVAKYESERIEQIENAMQQINKSRESQLTGLWESNAGAGVRAKYKEDYNAYMEAARERFQRHIKLSYEIHGNLSSPYDSKKRKRIWGAKKYLTDIPKTVDVVVGNWITEHIKEIFESNQNMKYFEKLAVQYIATGVANTDTIREMLVKSIVNDGVKHTVEILEKSYKNLPIKEFMDTLTQQIEETREYKIEGYYSNFGQYGRQLDFFNGKTLKSGLEVANELYDAYVKLCKRISSDSHKNTKDETYFMSVMKKTSHMQTYNRMISLIHKLEVKQREFESLQKEIQQGRRKDGIDRSINLGASGNGEDIILKVKITAKGPQFEGMSLQEGINSLSLMKKIGNGHTNATSIQGIITGLKSKMSKSLRDDMSWALAQAQMTAMKKGTEKMQNQIKVSFERALTGLTLSVGGPKLSEISPGILNSLIKGVSKVHFPGSINRRNDFIIITLKWNDIHLESTLQDIMNHHAETLIDCLDPEIRHIQQHYINEFETSFYNKMRKLKSTDSNFNSLAENEKIWFEYTEQYEAKMKEIEEIREESDDLWAQYMQNARKEGKSEEEINEKRKAVLNSLKDSFFISDTMKTYNQYQNNLGFAGASLGANVQLQLTNINTLFKKVGIDMDQSDLTWLESAIINCSPMSIIGEKNKNIIENYLSSMAALAMFDEGSAETQIISDLNNKITERANSSPSILHLYRVNGMFVPGSVVLERTIEELSACLKEGSLAIETMNRGAGIVIINTMNEGLIPNRSTTSKRYQTFDEDPWGTVASATNSHVRLQIMFLAKLLDIVNNMNDMMSKVPILK